MTGAPIGVGEGGTGRRLNGDGCAAGRTIGTGTTIGGTDLAVADPGVADFGTLDDTVATIGWQGDAGSALANLIGGAGNIIG